MVDSREEPVGATVAERDEGQGDEGRDSIADISPVDSGDLANHHTANLTDTTVRELYQPGSAKPQKLTSISVLPVAQGGIDANSGEKNSEIRKQIPVTIAVRPVRPPSAIPALLSMKAVTGETPKSAPTEIHTASTQKATVDLGKSASSLRARLQKRAMEYSVAVQSMMST